jgi:import receptor subunit TOM20
MEINRTTVLAGVTTVAVGVVAYAAYFDYRRRHDPNFRKAIRREQKRVSTMAKEKLREAQMGEEEAIKQAHRSALSDPLPTSPEEKEALFMQEVARGEQLYALGESAKYDAAVCFYRALKMYPQPEELTRIYAQTIPPVRLIIVRLPILTYSMFLKSLSSSSSWTMRSTRNRSTKRLNNYLVVQSFGSDNIMALTSARIASIVLACLPYDTY